MPHVWIDLEAKDLAEKLLARMVHPADPDARADYLVTVGAIGKQAVKNLAPQYGAEAAEAVAEIEELYLQPNGGDGRLAHARGVDLIRQDAMDAGGKYGIACGEVLFNIATLDRHHPDLRASKNLAMHIMVCRAKHEGREIPAERDRKTMWEKWGPVAPLWAAYIVCRAAAGRRGIPWSFPQWTTLIVSTSLSFADFAVGFKASGAEDYLLSESEDVVVRVNPDMEPTDPELWPFSDQELGWARTYKAYKAKPLTKKQQAQAKF
jgi:hypothetical protein